MRIVVILPTYNEKENIAGLLDTLEGITGKIRNHAFCFLVADDTSPDGTEEVVKKYQKSHQNVYLLTGKKEGLGKALLRGMAYATNNLEAEILVQMDADLSHDPEVLPQMIAEIDKGADFVLGSRYIPGGSIPDNWGAIRKLYSVIGNAIVRFGLGFTQVHDWTGGYRVYRRKFYELSKRHLSRYGGYVFQIAFLHKSILNGAKVAEVPFHFTDRRYGHSKIIPSQYIRDIFVYIAKSRTRSLMSGPFLKFCVVGGIGFIINTVILELFVAFGFHPAAGSAVGAEIAIISNFILNNMWTFRHRKIEGKRVWGKFMQFNAASVGAIVLQAGTVAVGSMIWGDNGKIVLSGVPLVFRLYQLYYIIGVGFGLIWNYTMYSKVIWKK